MKIYFSDASLESDHFMSADEALTFGLIDKVEKLSIN
jgi:ATP-dependent protease ClpP protease subunit